MMRHLILILLFVPLVTACSDDKDNVTGTAESAKVPLAIATDTEAASPSYVSGPVKEVINMAEDTDEMIGGNVEYTRGEPEDENFIDEIDEEPEKFIEAMEQEAEDLKENMIEEARQAMEAVQE